MSRPASAHAAAPALRIGFIPLTDSAPLLVARERDLFRRHGVRVELSCEVGWATIREKLLYGQVDAAHAIAGLALAMRLGLSTPPCAVVAPFVFNLHGNAITLSRDLWNRGVRDAASLKKLIRSSTSRRFTFGMVSRYSSHSFLLRRWLAAGGIDADRDVRLVALPPTQMAANLGAGHNTFILSSTSQGEVGRHLAFSGLGEYEYRQRGLSNPEVGGRLFDADLALGYRYVTGNWVIGGFAGVHLHDFDLFDSDPTNPGEGTDWGARFGLDITGTTGPIYWSAIGQYSTVEEAIWSRARVGYMFGRVTIGPEFVYLEDDRFDEYRIGGFVRVKILENLSVTGAAGSAYYDGQFQDDDQSFYGSLGLVVTF